MTIRDFRAGDEAALLAALRGLQNHESQFNPRTRPAESMGQWYVERLLREVADTHGRLLVAEDSAGVIGYASLLFFTADDEKDELPHSYAAVSDLAVAPEARGRGAGSALLAACEDIARGCNVDLLRIGVLAQNHRARALYLRSGFAEMHVTLEKGLR